MKVITSLGVAAIVVLAFGRITLRARAGPICRQQLSRHAGRPSIGDAYPDPLACNLRQEGRVDGEPDLGVPLAPNAAEPAHAHRELQLVIALCGLVVGDLVAPHHPRSVAVDAPLAPEP